MPIAKSFFSLSVILKDLNHAVSSVSNIFTFIFKEGMFLVSMTDVSVNLSLYKIKLNKSKYKQKINILCRAHKVKLKQF